MNRNLLLLATLASAALFAPRADAQTIGCATGGSGGAIPTTGTGGGTFPTALPTAPSSFTLSVASVPPGATVVTEVKLLGLTHTYVQDLQFVLTDPSGATHNLFCRAPFPCDLGGDYTIVQPCTGVGQAFPATCTTALIFPTGPYDQYFGAGALAWPSGTNGIVNTPLTSIAAATGTWTLTVYDWAGADIGALTSFDVCFGTPQTPAAPTAAPTLTTPLSNANVFGPLVNLVWGDAPCATSYDVEVDGVVFAAAANSFSYTSSQGAHMWRARGKNAAGIGPWSSTFTFNDIGVPPTPCVGPSLSAGPFIGGNGLGTNSAVYFDLDVLNPAGITLSEVDTNADATIGTLFTLEIWTKSGSYVGFETNALPWTLAATGNGVSTGDNTASLVEFPDIALAPGVTGVALRIIGAGHSYTNGTGANQFYANSDLTITLGKSQSTLFSSGLNDPRVWNGAIRYNCAGAGPVVFCTAGTSTNGCVPALTASAQPSASFASPCVLTAVNIERQKSGMIFYGINNTGFAPVPWAPSSSSFFCVKSPVQRSLPQNSGGVTAPCDGQLQLDWNAFHVAFPGSLGAPFSAGAKVFAQAWYRDPPAPRTTNLSDAVELTMLP